MNIKEKELVIIKDEPDIQENKLDGDDTLLR